MTDGTSYPLSRMTGGGSTQRKSHSRHSSITNNRDLLDDDDDDITVFTGGRTSNVSAGAGGDMQRLAYDVDEDGSDGEGGSGGRRRTKAYADEDTRPTSTKEIYGWYSYAWASEVFAICAIGSFIPVLLEQLAREKGHIEGDRSTKCTGSEAAGGAGSAPTNSTAAEPGHQPVCAVDILGFEVNTASFVMYTFSLSVMFQAFVIISMSGAADHGRYRKQLLLLFAYIGAVSCMLMLFVNADLVVIASLLAQIGNVSFGASYVLLNSFLPLIVRNHASIRALASVATTPATSHNPSTTNLLDDDDDDDTHAEDATLLGGHSTSTSIPKPHATADDLHSNKNAKMTPAMRLSTRISSNGIAIGYSSGVLLQIMCIGIVIASKSSTTSIQVSIFCVGLWWFFFTIPSAMTLRPRPGPPLPLEDGQALTWSKYITYSWRGLFKTIGQASQLKDVALFLIAWFMVSDGVATIASSAIVFAKTNLGMTPPQLAAIGVIMPISGVIGAFSWPKISNWAGWSVSQTILICIAMFALIPLYGLTGLLEPIKKMGLGLTRPAEMYALAIWFGFVLGGQGGYCRSLFSELLPRGSEAAFFALYAITDKGSSVFGPTVVGIITDKWGDIRLAFWFILVLLLVPLPFLYFVDVNRGKKAAEDFVLKNESRREATEGGFNR